MNLAAFMQLTAAVFLAMLLLLYYIKGMYLILSYFEKISKKDHSKNSEL